MCPYMTVTLIPELGNIDGIDLSSDFKGKFGVDAMIFLMCSPGNISSEPA